jgi:hypothetical protein
MQLTQDKLKEHLSYDPNTGIFIWIKPKARRTKIGSIAGSPVVRGGYLSIMIDGINYSCHQLAWLYVYGYIPIVLVDHKNTIPTDNRIDNLRLATKTQNAYNAKTPSTNTTGVKGVYVIKGKYVARVTANGKTYSFGCHSTLDAAATAVRAGRTKLHGEYANHG